MELSKSEIQKRITALIEELIQDDLETDQIDDDTLLYRDLDITSLGMVDLFVAIEESLDRKVGFHNLVMRDGKYITDIGFGELIAYIDNKINATQLAPSSLEENSVTSQNNASFDKKLDSEAVSRFRKIIPPTLPLDEAGPVKNQRPIFVLSAPRSGSTLFRIILAGHPALFAPPELHLLQYPTLQDRKKVYSYSTNEHLLEGTIQAIATLKNCGVEEAKNFIHKCEDQQMTTQQLYKSMQDDLGERILVDKTPAYAYHLNVLERAELIFDNPLYIFLVRHPQGSFQSFMDAELDRFFPFMWRNASSFTREEFAELNWTVCNENITNFLTNIPERRQYRIRFEDLVTSPKSTLGALCQFLDLPFNPEMLDPYKEKSQRMTGGLENASRMGGDLKFHLHQKIEPDIADRWKQAGTASGLSDITWELAEKLGYQND